MTAKIHLISGLPRSGSTLLGALLRQNPRFYASMTSPVGSLVNRMLEAMSEENEYSVFITPEQKRALTLTIFSTFYEPQAQKKVIFDTNRLWCSKLSLIQELFPGSKVICCVRNVAWIMDSIERLIRKNAFDVSRMFTSLAQSLVKIIGQEDINGIMSVQTEKYQIATKAKDKIYLVKDKNDNILLYVKEGKTQASNISDETLQDFKLMNYRINNALKDVKKDLVER